MRHDHVGDFLKARAHRAHVDTTPEINVISELGSVLPPPSFSLFLSSHRAKEPFRRLTMCPLTNFDNVTIVLFLARKESTSD